VQAVMVQLVTVQLGMMAKDAAGCVMQVAGNSIIARSLAQK